MARLFGTDGVRGVANLELTGELAYRLGRAAGHHLATGVDQPRVLVGRDTRISGDLLEAALVAGFLSVGVDAITLGVVPTPGVAFLTRHTGAAGGAVISASHNPPPDNGIKFLSAEGYKLAEPGERTIEEFALADPDVLPRPTGTGVGRWRQAPDLVNEYLDHLVATAGTRLDGLRLVVDTAHGATCRLAPLLLERLGARVTAINASPEGANINVDCGATHPLLLGRSVVEGGADAGVAYDGDGDRAIAVDEKGEVVDGDQIMAACGLYLVEQGRLPRRGIVATVMSNIGLELAFQAHGGRVVRTPVGDRHVLEAMLREGMILGGEQSGHLIFLDAATTGDGLLTTIRLLGVMVATGQPLSKLAARMTKYPQVLLNVRVRQKPDLEAIPGLPDMLAKTSETLGPKGRVVLRPSGTEPLVRVMVEGEDADLVESSAREVAGFIAGRLGQDG
ncbi:MAG: phosphoglucosamine mutase [bacterium]|nr:phosphoglucosamine mutase [bacterium]